MEKRSVTKKSIVKENKKVGKTTSKIKAKEKTNKNTEKISKGNPKALLPLVVFLVFYLGIGFVFEYALKINMGFYNIPIVLIFLVALIVASLQNKKVSFDEKLELMGKNIGDKNIVIMVLIFLLAGLFVGVVGRSSAASVAYFFLSLVPMKFAVAILFIVSCFVSLAMGTSVGTITLVTPIACEVALASNFNMALCVATVVGGAMFGDNLSFISDTTIAACNGQGCKMKDKFNANFKIALPAAVLTLVIILISSFQSNANANIIKEYELIKITPYILVLIGGLIGINVFVVLLIGIVSGSLIMLVSNSITFVDLLSQMGAGISGMFETIMVAILVAALSALIKEYGGFDAIVYFIKKNFKGNVGGLFGIGFLVSIMDIATANNTVAIVMANPIAKELSNEYGIDKKDTASILDIFSCIMQGIIPYGAQMLVAIAAVNSLGKNITAFEIMQKLYYPYALLLVVIVYILFVKKMVKTNVN